MVAQPEGIEAEIVPFDATTQLIRLKIRAQAAVRASSKGKASATLRTKDRMHPISIPVRFASSGS